MCNRVASQVHTLIALATYLGKKGGVGRGGGGGTGEHSDVHPEAVFGDGNSVLV